MTTTFHRHWRDVRESAWRWPNFSPAEIACRGTGKLLLNEPALDRLQALRDRLGKPLIVRSAYRSPEHNRTVGGATRTLAAYPMDAFSDVLTVDGVAMHYLNAEAIQIAMGELYPVAARITPKAG